MQPRNVTGLPADHGDADVTVADTDRVIGAYRFFFFHRARPGSFHAEHRFVKPRLADEIFTDDGKVLNPGEHRPPFDRVPKVPIVQVVPIVECTQGQALNAGTVGTAGTFGTKINSPRSF